MDNLPFEIPFGFATTFKSDEDWLDEWEELEETLTLWGAASKGGHRMKKAEEVKDWSVKAIRGELNRWRRVEVHVQERRRRIRGRRGDARGLLTAV